MEHNVEVLPGLLERLIATFQRIGSKHPSRKPDDLGVATVDHLVLTPYRIRVGTNVGPIDSEIPEAFQVDREQYNSMIPVIVEEITQVFRVPQLRSDLEYALREKDGISLHHNGLCFIGHPLVEGMGEVDSLPQ